MAFPFSSSYSMTLHRKPNFFNEINNPKVGSSSSHSTRKLCRQRQLFRLGGSSLRMRKSLKCFPGGQEKQHLAQESEAEDEQVSEFGRLFSNLNQTTLKREPGSLSSAIFLVAGTTVGAGILAIPAVTQDSGFLASAVTCVLCWIFMVVTGLLIAEVNVNTMRELGSGGVSLVSMSMRTLGNTGVQVACWSYVFIHYALLVAYIARSSDILTNFLGIPLFHALISWIGTFFPSCLVPSFPFVPPSYQGQSMGYWESFTSYFFRWESATLFSLLFGGLCYFGNQRIIGAVNGVLVLGIIGFFAALVAVASGDLHWDALLKSNFEAVPRSIPIIALSFVYQNVVPVLCTNLEGNLSKVRTAIVSGTGIPLALFLVWNAVILGTITSSGIGSDTLFDPLQQLRSTNGVVGPIVDVFSFLAIATSYIGFVLGLADFLADLLKRPPGRNEPLQYMLILIPPLIMALLYPEIFFKALDFAGTYGVLVLFGLLPAAMSWVDRGSVLSESSKVPVLVPGGNFTLSLVIGAAGLVILTELLDDLGFAWQ
ncbi:uncharacterized protein [Henckelia pumila]|uniref:uncharacterized protein isoform X1 n=1 Tax=Henckelia pumila TaxID=405737 RepID=UPI003C6E1092